MSGSTINAKQELIDHLQSLDRIECAHLAYRGKTFILRKAYLQEQLQEFLAALDFEYDAGYGIQELTGIVLLTNEQWLERGEYDGAEWWITKERPHVPIHCLPYFNPIASVTDDK